MAALVKAAKVILIVVFGSGKPDLKLHAGDLYGNNINSKKAAHSEVQEKVSGLVKDPTIIDACYTRDHLVFARNGIDHEITCTIPERKGGNKRRKKSKKTKKRKTMKKKKLTKKRKTMKKKK